VKVTKIKGNWAYVEGRIAHGTLANQLTPAGGWINLSKLDWYWIVEEKKGS
jgi:hypothetical protein